MRRFFRPAVVLLALCLAMTGCVSSGDKARVRTTVKTFFYALQTQDFATANALTVSSGEEGIASDIDKNAANALIFSRITYELWGIEQRDGALCAHLMITQVSLAKAYENTVREFREFEQSAKDANRAYSDEAIETRWNEIFCRHIRGTEDTVEFDVRVPMTESDGLMCFLMTSEFRNALFGGELDAIKALESIQKGEE